MFSRAVKFVAQQPIRNLPRTLGTVKTSTGIVGLAVDPDGRNTILKLSKEGFSRIKVACNKF